MHVLALASQKGGAGKSTLAFHLAVAAESDGAGPVALVDTDPQATLTRWWEARQAETPKMAKGEVTELQALLRSSKGHRLPTGDYRYRRPVFRGQPGDYRGGRLRPYARKAERGRSLGFRGDRGRLQKPPSPIRFCGLSGYPERSDDGPGRRSAGLTWTRGPDCYPQPCQLRGSHGLRPYAPGNRAERAGGRGSRWIVGFCASTFAN